tara:strand:+ start:72 stop:185 length:114 start_codon:yes stop_codon:yes gene_type:complete
MFFVYLYLCLGLIFKTGGDAFAVLMGLFFLITFLIKG